MSLTSTLKAVAFAGATLAGAATPASATLVTLDKEGASVWGAPVLARNVRYTIDGTARYHGAGMFRLKDASTAEAILAFCIDIFQVLKLPHVYDTTSYLDTTRLGQIEALYSNFYADVDTADEAAAFQLALWEISTEISTTHDLSSGRFVTTETGEHYTIAEDYLNGLTGPATANWDITTYFSDTSQDLVSGNYVSVASVPVPFAGLLLLTGLVGINGLHGRKRRSV